jgi:hypothetical protein
VVVERFLILEELSHHSFEINMPTLMVIELSGDVAEEGAFCDTEKRYGTRPYAFGVVLFLPCRTFCTPRPLPSN